ncbi:hypothetical protein F2P81_004381 [Scophthalmus maximus]|uniref:Uncharacterized protein n=1 Tax=Scophthalmus maximus TaxID=52904 RepID=A0A6A4TIK8_SCOMX|nr:hypothetical protein F2P81_004381 [Scophthalmus maximus]
MISGVTRLNLVTSGFEQIAYLNPDTLRQEGRPLQHHQLLLLHVCDSLVALEKWGSCVFPDGQVSKSRDESKPRAWKSSAHLRKPLLL